jgi:mono/diheme cytochrome c family protein/small nuclear ribonucleoprotein (snRNP)-like protein
MAALLGLVLQAAAPQQAPKPDPAATPDAPHGGQQAPAPAAAPLPPLTGFAASFPQHPLADAATIERGKSLWGANCTFCHGADARGGSGGPSLIRSPIVLNDKNGELMTPLVQNGIADKMPKLSLTAAQVSDIAAYVHSFRVSGYDAARQKPISIMVGNAKAGEAYFQAKCASCHSVAADLKGFATKFSDPRAMQQNWLMPSGGRGGAATLNVPPTTVTVTLASGQKVEGHLVRIDDFTVTLSGADNVSRTFRREGDNPKVEVHDPLQPHKALLAVYTDKDIHDVTAYLVTLK